MNSLFLLHFLNDGVRTAIISLLPFVARDLHLSFTQVGVLGSSQGILGAFLSFPAGFIASRIGGYKIILLSLAAYSIGSFAIGLSPEIITFFIAFYAATIGFGMFHVIGFSLISRISDAKNVGRNLGNFTAVGDMGRVVIPAAAIFAVPFLSWRGSYLSMAAIGFTVFILLVAISKKRNIEAKQSSKTSESHREWGRQVLLLFKQKKLRLIVAAAVIDSLGGYSIYIFLPFLLLAKGVDVATLGIFTGVYFAGSLFGKSTLGRAVDRFGMKTFIVAELLMAACLVVLTLSWQIIFLLPIAFFLGLFTRGTTPVITTLLSKITHADHYEKLFAVSETALSITAAVAPIIMGIVADEIGIKAVFYTAVAFACLAALPVVVLQKQK